MSGAAGQDQNPPKVEVRLVGPFQVIGPLGEDLRPRLVKSRALLALLALSRNMSRTRAALQDKLWGESPGKQGTMNLRSALSDIRRGLGPYRDCLVTDGAMVGLAPDRVALDMESWLSPELSPLRADRSGSWTDREEIDALPILLEDIDIQESEFEDWLRDERSAFENMLLDLHNSAPKIDTDGRPQLRVVETATPNRGPASPVPWRQGALSKQSVEGAVVQGPASRDKARPVTTPWLQILAPTSTIGDAALFYSNVMTASIAQSVSDIAGVAVRVEPGDGFGVGLRIDVTINAQGGGVAVIAVLDGRSSRVFWSGVKDVPSGDGVPFERNALSRLVNQTTDMVLSALKTLADERAAQEGAPHSRFSLGMDAISKMFKLGRTELDEAETLLDRSIDLEPSGAALAWKAYLRTFLVAEHGFDPRDVSDQVREFVSKAIELAPANSYVLALSSYVHSFILQETSAARELAEQSVDLAPSNPMGASFLGLAKAYGGDPEAGYRMVQDARQRVGAGPHRYAIDFLGAVTATLAGRFDDAIALTEIVRAKKPDYKPAYRYLTALYLNKGDRRRAFDAMETLRRTEPDFSLYKMREPGYPSAALRAAGLLRLVDPDFE